VPKGEDWQHRGSDGKVHRVVMGGGMVSRISWQSREGLGARLEHPREAGLAVYAYPVKSGSGAKPGRSGRSTEDLGDHITLGEERTGGRFMVLAVVASASARGLRP